MDTAQPRYTERLGVPLRWWVQATMMVASFWLALVVALPGLAAWGITALVMAVVAAAYLTYGSAVVEVAAPLKIAVKRLPDISRAGDLGETPIEVLPVSLEDLLGRHEIRLDIEEVARLIEGRCIAVTGAGGSIGSELVAQIADTPWDALMLAVDVRGGTVREYAGGST